jgi:hypothetical protein
MTDQVASVVEPFVRRGLFPSPEKAVAEMARDYIRRQIQHYQSVIEGLQAKYGMTYDQFTTDDFPGHDIGNVVQVFISSFLLAPLRHGFLRVSLGD